MRQLDEGEHPQVGDFCFDFEGDFTFTVSGYDEPAEQEYHIYHVPEEEIGEFLLEHPDSASQIINEGIFLDRHSEWKSVTSPNVLHLLKYQGVI
jgi:hypothetical protein